MNTDKENNGTKIEYTEYAGIDYGLGQSNIDYETGIHYGVINQHTVGQAWYDDAEPDYGNPTCPKCGNDAHEYQTEDYQYHMAHTIDEIESEYEHAKYECDDYVCHDCRYVFGSESAFPDEALGFNFEDSEYKLTDCLDSDIFILKSPYYTFAQYCSPCVPGAGNLDNPMVKGNGVKCYCLGHEWFEDGIAPYDVYRVSDDKQIIAKREMVTCDKCNGLGHREISEIAKIRQQTLTECMNDMLSNPIHSVNVDIANKTIQCWNCQGNGKVETVVETVI